MHYSLHDFPNSKKHADKQIYQFLTRSVYYICTTSKISRFDI